jgi:uncharacterized repeat protein (TIGR01451 family)
VKRIFFSIQKPNPNIMKNIFTLLCLLPSLIWAQNLNSNTFAKHIYDGNGWHGYTQHNSSFQDWSHFIGVTADTSANIWTLSLGDFSGETLSKFDGTNWTSFSADDHASIRVNPCYGAHSRELEFQESTNLLWYLSPISGCFGDHNLVSFDGNDSFTVYDSSHFNNSHPWKIQVDAQSNLWAFTPNGFYRYNNNSWNYYPDTLFVSSGSSLYQAPDHFNFKSNSLGEVFFVTPKRLYQYSNNTWQTLLQFDTIPNVGNVTTSYVDDSDTLWMVHSGSHFIGYNTLNGAYTTIFRPISTIGLGISYSTIEQLTYHNDTLYGFKNNKGVVIVHNDSLLHYFKDYPLFSNVSLYWTGNYSTMRDICISPEGKLLLTGRGLYKRGSTNYNSGLHCQFFEDLNGNGMQDNGELPLTGIYHCIDSLSCQYSDYQGKSIFNLENGQYTLSVHEDLYSVSSPMSQLQNIIVNNLDTLATSVKIGLTPLDNIADASSHLTLGKMVAGESSFLSISIVNNGTDTLDGQLEFSYDNSLNNAVFSLTPDSIQNQTAYWTFTNLLPTEKRHIHYFDSIPLNLLGDTLSYSSHVTVINDNELDNNSDSLHQEVMNLAFNDLKEVSPSGVCDSNYTLIDQELEYTVHFQNTYHYVAKNVIVTDTLSSHLDLTSFKMLNSSHHMFTDISPEGVLSTTFANINLLNDTNGNIQSCGFMTYSIKAKDEVGNGTIIRNSAETTFNLGGLQHIKRSNTTWNTLTDLLPPASCVVDTTSGLDENSQLTAVFVYPNPTRDILYVDEGNIKHIYDLYGRILMSSRERKIDVSHLPKGMYILQIDTAQQKFIKQ